MAAADNTDLQGFRVLVVDDSRTIRGTAESLLARVGCEVRLAADGFEALALVLEFRPDLVFVDIMMPRLDGYRTCALIHRHPLLRDTPVVMLSSRNGLFDRAKGRLAGARGYLAKPFTGDELLGMARSVLLRADTGESP